MAVPQQEIRDRLDELTELKRRYREFEKQAKVAKADHDAAQHDLWQDMFEAGMTGFKTDVGSYVRKSTVYGTVQDMDAFTDWCERQGLSDEFIKPAAQAQRLNEIVRSAVDNGEELPDGVGYYAREYISITESK